MPGVMSHRQSRHQQRQPCNEGVDFGLHCVAQYVTASVLPHGQSLLRADKPCLERAAGVTAGTEQGDAAEAGAASAEGQMYCRLSS